MQSRNSKIREKFIEKQTAALDNRIASAQNRLFRILESGVIDGLPTEPDGVLTNTTESIFNPNRIDALFDQFRQDHIKPILDKVEKGVNKLIDHNDKYFASVKKNNIGDSVRSSALSALGIGGGVLAAGSLLFNILNDREVLNTLKTVVMSSIAGGLTITALKVVFKEIVLKREGGILKKLFREKLPDPYVRIDRFVGRSYAVGLDLNFAIYQGGIIKTSRPFCVERNNKVFSREEISRFGSAADQFGGYENKTTGDFQGKPQNYNPFTDLGGYNCRHQLDWISDELAFHLRPDLNTAALN